MTQQEELVSGFLAHGGEMIPELKEMADRLRQEMEDRRVKLSLRRPFEDDGRPLRFYPVSRYSKIMNVPDNVSDDWLDLAIEAGELLLARQDPADARM